MKFLNCTKIFRLFNISELIIRGMGIGTTVLTDNLKDDYYSIVLAPDNEDAKRLYQRLGEECNRIPGCDHEFGYFDQGYGVYVI